MQNSLLLASILGPILIALSISEYLNFKIWENTHPTLVYLNGLILLTGGIIIIRIHNSWIPAWPTLITLTGWLITLAGLGRMFFPTAKQLPKNYLSISIIATLLIIGIVLSIKAYGPAS
uniref:hypothetical protein n=1 Tax=Chitinophaga sancti TaxID=1004 RepID=UPI003F78BA95